MSLTKTAFWIPSPVSKSYFKIYKPLFQFVKRMKLNRHLFSDSNYEKDLIKDWSKTKARKLPLVPSIVANIYFGKSELPSPCIARFSEHDKCLIPTLRLDKVENSLGSMVGFKVVSHGKLCHKLLSVSLFVSL